MKTQFKKITGRRERIHYLQRITVNLIKLKLWNATWYSGILTWGRLFTILNRKYDCGFLSLLFFSLSCHPFCFLSIYQHISCRGAFIGSAGHGVSITAWVARCDYLITAKILPLIARAIITTFRKSQCWSRGRCNVWNMGWSGGVTDSINVGDNQ